MNGTLQEVYSDTNFHDESTHNNSSRKRSRSVTDYDVDDRNDNPEVSSELDEQNTSDVLEIPVSCRPIKPLSARARRPLLETRSLPAGAFTFGTNDQSSNVLSLGTTAEKVDEEDWSQEDSLQVSEPPFEPMTL